jgi:hypothetical protein
MYVGASDRKRKKRRGSVAGAPTSAFHLVAGPPSGDVLPRCVHRDKSVSTPEAGRVNNIQYGLSTGE